MERKLNSRWGSYRKLLSLDWTSSCNIREKTKNCITDLRRHWWFVFVNHDIICFQLYLFQNKNAFIRFQKIGKKFQRFFFKIWFQNDFDFSKSFLWRYCIFLSILCWKTSFLCQTLDLFRQDWLEAFQNLLSSRPKPVIFTQTLHNIISLTVTGNSPPISGLCRRAAEFCDASCRHWWSSRHFFV